MVHRRDGNKVLSGDRFAIRIRVPPVPSRRQDSRLYHVAQPICAVEEIRAHMVEPVVSFNGSPQLPVLAISASAQKMIQAHVSDFIFPPFCVCVAFPLFYLLGNLKNKYIKITLATVFGLTLAWALVRFSRGMWLS